jgi:diacylglycerol diphosphate phosphatase/phosphatidate phosphatase
MSFNNLWQKTVLQDIFYNDGDWFDQAYLMDWYINSYCLNILITTRNDSCRTVATAFWVLSGLVTLSPVFQREFSTDDPLISHPHTHEQ